MSIDNVARGIAVKALNTASQAGTGDMVASDYDENNAVKNAGGISDFVHNHIDTIRNFVVPLNENVGQGTYTTTVTYDQIKSAYENGREVLVNIDNKAVLPLMSADFEATTGSFVFGYTRANEDCSGVTTRAVSYYHTPTDDTWEDMDSTCDPLLLVGQDPINVPVATPTQSIHAANKDYVDTKLTNTTESLKTKIASKVPIVQADEGVIKAYVQNGSKTDVCILSNNGKSSCIARYDASGRLISGATPSANNHLVNKKYVDDSITTASKSALPIAGGSISGNLQVGGNLTVSGTISQIGIPTQGVDVTTKDYVDTQISNSVNDVLRKEGIAVAENSTVEVALSNGVYLLTVSDNAHGGLVCVAIYPDGMNINALVGINGWKCEKMTKSEGVKLTNTTTTDMTIYLTSIGEGAYR